MHYASGTTFLFGVIFLALIEIRNLCKTFGTGSTAVHALEDVSLDIEAGEISGSSASPARARARWSAA